MKKIFIILFLIIPFSTSQRLYAQTVVLTDREILLKLSEKVDKLAEQQIKFAEQQTKLIEQQTATTLEIKGISMEIKGMQKHIEMLFTLVICILTGIFGLVVLIFWDRRAAIRPIEIKSNELKLENEIFAKEIALLKEREAKLEERETKLEEKLLKNEVIFKKLFEKFPDLASSI